MVAPILIALSIVDLIGGVLLLYLPANKIFISVFQVSPTLVFYLSAILMIWLIINFMEKRRVSYMLIFLLMAGFLMHLISAEKIDIELENNYLPGENVNFRIILYDNNNIKLDGIVNYIIQDDYKEKIICNLKYLNNL